MNNWLEHRCPLAVYGCGFSHRRMNPGSQEAKRTLIFSPAVESFGIKILPENEKSKPTKTKSKSKLPTTTLTDLPLEILIDIIMYLDSFRKVFLMFVLSGKITFVKLKKLRISLK